MKFSKGSITIDRNFSELDKFTLDYIKILRKHTKYVIVSGYVSILLGRARVSEDIDITIPKCDYLKFQKIVSELQKKGFYCLNATKPERIFEYINEKFAVRFAKKGTVIPNVELKFAKNIFDDISLNKTLQVNVGQEEYIISNLELQIAFKEIVLKSPKDMEDARHIRNVAKGYLNERLIKKYEVMLHDFY